MQVSVVFGHDRTMKKETTVTLFRSATATATLFDSAMAMKRNEFRGADLIS